MGIQVDATDLQILHILLQDGRMSYEKIAKKVRLSPNAVRNRIDKMVKTGIIIRFVTYLNPILFNQSICFSLATLKERTIQSKLIEQMKEWKEVVGITTSVENKITIVHHFKYPNQMHQTVEKLKELPEIIGMKNYILLIPSSPGQFPSKITKNDWRIIRALRDNCRKTDVELAAELDLSPKTIMRRISYLRNNGVVVFMIELDTASGDLLTYELILTLQEVNSKIISKLQSEIKDIFYIWRVANAEVLIITVRITHLAEIITEIVDLETYVPTKMYYPRGWYDDFIEDQIKLNQSRG
ncbi:MAG: AsnC family transcriptional regulator [Promethearchaeota archaeon]